MDEIDAIGGRRFSEGTSADREIQRTLMELLNQMDGFDRLGQVKFIMATNRPDVLDPALLRPGRLDRKIGMYSIHLIFLLAAFSQFLIRLKHKIQLNTTHSPGQSFLKEDELPLVRVEPTTKSHLRTIYYMCMHGCVV